MVIMVIVMVWHAWRDGPKSDRRRQVKIISLSLVICFLSLPGAPHANRRQS